MTALAEAERIAAAGMFPETFWDVEDDLCDCTYQRIGMWTNPYLAETLEVRMCCIWKELYNLFPDYVRVTPAFKNYNTGEWEAEPQPWNGESDMPPSIWYRHLARKTGRSVADVREEYSQLDHLRPRGVQRPPEPEPEPQPDMIEVLFEMIEGLADEVAHLRAAMEARP